VNVRLEDGACRSCGGPLQILDSSRSLTVTCVECCDSYDVETDAIGDGCMTDYFPFTSKRLRGEEVADGS
jgi:hypothetical protein